MLKFYLILLLSISCGYHLENRRKKLPDGSKTIYIEPFRNNTTAARVENYFTDAIKKQFYINKDIKVVALSEANAILRGTVETISQKPTAFKKSITENLEAREYLMTIQVSVVLVNRDGNVFWTKNLSDQEIYNVYENTMKSESERLKATSRISDNIMRKLYNNIFASFSNES